MSKSLPIVAYPALQLLLLSYLRQVIYPQSDVSLLSVSSLALETVSSPSDRGDGLFDNPLHRVRDSTKIAYRSAIAHKLAKISERSAVSWAAEIANQLQKPPFVGGLWKHDSPRNIALDSGEFIVKVLPPAEIYIEITNSGLASWLQFLLHTLLEEDFQLISSLKSDFVTDVTSGNFPSQPNSELQNVFVCQYAYARCCSLLHLAETHHLWDGSSLRDVKNTGSSAIAAQIPWLTPEGHWQLTHPAEQALISELVTTLDTLATWGASQKTALGSPQLLLELVTRLAEAFLGFHSACRFWGETQKTAFGLVQARLGLVEVTRSLLGTLLRAGLKVVAPTEL